jgi:hypothetical protein
MPHSGGQLMRRSAWTARATWAPLKARQPGSVGPCWPPKRPSRQPRRALTRSMRPIDRATRQPRMPRAGVVSTRPASESTKRGPCRAWPTLCELLEWGDPLAGCALLSREVLLGLGPARCWSGPTARVSVSPSRLQILVKSAFSTAQNVTPRTSRQARKNGSSPMLLVIKALCERPSELT